MATQGPPNDGDYLEPVDLFVLGGFVGIVITLIWMTF